jgi:nucleoside-diphosphate-sugar epimerase
MEGHDTVINLATHIPSSALKMLFKRFWAENDRIRSQGVRNLVDAALACGVTRFIQESFAPAYPDCGDEWIDETTPLDPGTYNRSILDAESAVNDLAAANRIGVILRFALFYGPDARQLKSMIRAVKLGVAPVPGSPRAFVSSISHDDAARAVVAALTAQSGPYNIGDDQPMRKGEYFAELAHAIGVDPPRFLPEWAKPMFGASAEPLARSIRISNRKFRGETGWHPLLPSVHEGWRATLRPASRAPIRAPA